eukprot:755437-Hanusia_phi.AAC.1
MRNAGFLKFLPVENMSEQVASFSRILFDSYPAAMEQLRGHSVNKLPESAENVKSHGQDEQ